MTDVRERRTTYDTVNRRVWSPGQVISGLIGLLLTVMGGVALARLLPTESITGASAEVFGIAHTVLMGIIAIGLGLLFLAQAASPYAVKRGLLSLGVATLAFGLVVVIEPSAFDNALGMGSEGGWLYAAIGFISLISAVAAPVFSADR